MPQTRQNDMVFFVKTFTSRMGQRLFAISLSVGGDLMYEVKYVGTNVCARPSRNSRTLCNNIQTFSLANSLRSNAPLFSLQEYTASLVGQEHTRFNVIIDLSKSLLHADSAP